MVHTSTTDRLGEIIAAEFERAGLASQRAREAATGIKRLTLERRMVSGGFTVPELELIAAALGTTVSALLAQAERAA